MLTQVLNHSRCLFQMSRNSPNPPAQVMGPSKIEIDFWDAVIESIIIPGSLVDKALKVAAQKVSFFIVTSRCRLSSHTPPPAPSAAPGHASSARLGALLRPLEPGTSFDSSSLS